MDEQKKVVQDGKGMVCTCCGHYGMGAGCGCGYGCGHHWMGGRILRIVIALVVAGLIFGFGVKIGELRSELNGYGFGDHRGGYYMMGGYGGYGANGMMAPYGAAVPTVPPSQTQTPATPVK